MWNMFKVNNKDIRTTLLASFWCLYCYLWTYFTPCSSVSFVDFEQINADWECSYEKCHLSKKLDVIDKINFFLKTENSEIWLDLRQFSSFHEHLSCFPKNMIRRNFYERNAQVLHFIKYFLFQINNYLLSPLNARLITLLEKFRK